MSVPFKLTRDEVEMIIAALQQYTWECKPEHVVPVVIGKLTGLRNPEEAQRVVNEELKKHQAEHDTRKEQVVMLQAKLINIRDQMDIDSVVSGG